MGFLFLHLFVLFKFDVKRFFLHRQNNIPIIIKILRIRKLVVTTIPIIIGVEDRLFESNFKKKNL
jgi:hypothetical protein